MSSKTVSVRLTPETLAKLDTMAAAMQRPRAWLMAHAIERYVDTEAWQVTAIQHAADELKQGQADLVSHTGLAHLDNLGPYQRRAQHAGQCGVEVEGGR